jgi:hypothetical protein
MSLEVEKTRKVYMNIQRNLLYGIFGIVMSVVGFLIWIWAFMEKTGEHLLMFLSFGRMFGLDMLRNLPDSLTGMVVTKAALLGLASVIAILFSLWMIGYLKGENKLLVKDFISQIGNIHYFIGLGYLVASITTLIDWKLSIVVMLINLLLGALLAFVLTSNLFKIRANKIISFVSLSFGAYLILFILSVLVIF